MGHMTLICVSHSLTHSDTLDSDIVRRSSVMEMEVGDAGASRLGYYNTKQLLQQIHKRNVTRAPHLHPHFLTHERSLRTGARQRCACIFLVKT